MRQRARDLIEGHADLTADEIDHRLSAALVGYVHDVDPRHHAKEFGRHVSGAANACRRVAELPGLRLRDGTDLLYTYLHIDENSTDLTPDAGRKGNNRIMGVSLIRHGKTILSEGHVDRQTVDFYLRDRNSSKHK